MKEEEDKKWTIFLQNEIEIIEEFINLGTKSLNKSNSNMD